MRKVKFYLLMLMSLIVLSCNNDALNELAPNDDSLSLTTEEELSLQLANNGTGGVNGCYNALANNNMTSIKAANNISFANIANSYLVNSIQSNYDTYDNCRSQNPGPPPNPNEPEPQPSPTEPSPTEVPSDFSPELVFSILDGLDSNYGPSVLSKLLVAYQYFVSLNLHYSSPEERMLAIGKAIYEANVQDIYISEGYHGSYDNRGYYIYAGIEYLAGKIPVTTSIYNQYFTTNPNDHISFPAVKEKDGLIFAPASHDFEVLPVPLTVVIDYDAQYVFYETNMSDLNDLITLRPRLSTSIFYNGTNSKLYSDSSFTSYVPNGFYYLPSNHPNIYERNNYIVEISNGQIINQYQ